nr:globin [Austwickia sp. TVS 96-490-7B]
MGGAATFEQLTREFYRGVADDPLLRPMYPEDDLEPARQRLEWFLAQYWGGPTTYGERRGHPQLRRRHLPFAVTPQARDRWLHHMMAAVDTLDIDPDAEQVLRDYLTRAAFSLVNRMEQL